MRAFLFSSLTLFMAVNGAHAAPIDAPQPERAVPVAAADAPQWSQLKADERAVLAPLKSDWNTMEPQSRLKWQQIARRFPNMPPARQERVRERMNTWAQMDPEQRMRARQTFQRTNSLSREERRAQWEAYQALSPEEREALVHPASRTAPPTRAIGASPRPLGAPAEQPPHLQNGMPKLNVMPGMVDRTTLLPLRGPQGAAQIKPAERPASPKANRP